MSKKLNLNIEDLKLMYPTGNMQDMIKHFGVSRGALNRAASKNKIKRLTRDHRSERDLTPLMSDDLQAFYWIGFILADGCLFKSYLMVKLQESDRGFLDKLAQFVNSKTRFSKRNISQGGFTGQDSCVIQVSHKEVIDKLRIKFDIKPNKTYNPPDFSLWNFTEEQNLALIIGFIDGDGSITKNKSFANIDISNHFSWASFHLWANKVLFDWTKNSKSSTLTPLIKLNQNKLRVSQLTTFALFDFIEKNQLFVMERKWGGLSSHKQYVRDKLKSSKGKALDQSKVD